MSLQLEVMRQLVVDFLLVGMAIAVLISADLLTIDLMDVVENTNTELQRTFIIAIAVFLMVDPLFILYL